MLSVVASNGEKMLPVWYELSYRITSAVCEEILKMKVLSWVSNMTKKLNYVFQQNGAPLNQLRFFSKNIFSPIANTSVYNHDFTSLEDMKVKHGRKCKVELLHMQL